VVLGIVFSVLDPYWLIWWASIGLGYIIHSLKLGLLGVTAFFLGHILADLTWYALISFGVAKGKHLFSNESYRKLIGGCAVFLILFSCWFFYSGIEKTLDVI
jgi:threonine/homoserine/homoserine lactone efflux protein